MTHVQNVWNTDFAYKLQDEVTPQDVNAIRNWCEKNRQTVPLVPSDELIILFLHSNYNNLEKTKTCIEEHYKLRRKAPQFFEHRDINRPEMQNLYSVLYYCYLREKTPDGYSVLYHSLIDPEPSKYVFNDAFKLFAMAIEALYVRQGPIPGFYLLLDMKGVKIGHVTRLPLISIKRAAEYLQEGMPMRLKAIHVINVHPVIDKIMLLLRPFIKKQFLSLLNFHKEGDEVVYNSIPKSMFPSEYGGDAESLEKLAVHFKKEMENFRNFFVEEEKMIAAAAKKQKGKSTDLDVDISHLEID